VSSAGRLALNAGVWRLEETMAKKKAELIEGPWVSAALLCEKVLEDKEGKLTVINIVDRLTAVPAPGALPPTIQDGQSLPTLFPVPVQLWLVIMLKSGFIRGHFDLAVELVEPSGKKTLRVEMPVLLEGEDRGVNVIMPMNAGLTAEGLYWFEVAFEGRILSKVPFRLIIQRVSTSQNRGSTPSGS